MFRSICSNNNGFFPYRERHKQDRATQSRVGLETQAFQHRNTIPKWYNHCCYPHHKRISIPYIHAERQDCDTAQVYTADIGWKKNSYHFLNSFLPDSGSAKQSRKQVTGASANANGSASFNDPAIMGQGIGIAVSQVDLRGIDGNTWAHQYAR